MLGNKNSIAYESWPKGDKTLTVSDVFTLVVQVNSKVRSKIELPTGAGKDEMLRLAKEDEKVSKWLEGKELVTKKEELDHSSKI